MPELTLYHIDPKSAFHLGQRGVGQEETGVHLPSDSLFAALVAIYSEAGGQSEELAQAFPQHGQEKPATAPPFLLTSAFPRAGAVRFYPVPTSLAFLLSETKRKELEDEGRLKEIKRIQFLSEGLFEKVVAGERLDTWLPTKGKSEPDSRGLYLQGTTLWLTADEVQKLPDSMQKDNGKSRPLSALRQLKVWQTSKAPRVTVDRIRNASNIFHTGRVHFGRECGLWFGLAWLQANSALKERVAQTLNLLSDAGLGGERAAGYGHFTYQEAGQRRWPDPAPQQLFVTLSRYHPRPTELPGAIQDERTAYKLISIGGWLNSPEAYTKGQAKVQRRRRLWLMAEGSVLQAVGQGPWGDIADVRPTYPSPEAEFPHPVWRYGLACPVALKGGIL